MAGTRRLKLFPSITPRYLTKVIMVFALLGIVLWLSGTQAVVARLLQFPPGHLLLIALLLAGNLWLVSFRFWRVLAHFGIRLPWAAASRACLAGHAAGLVMISLFGQVAGRQAVMRDYGVSPVVNASLAAYERVMLAVLSGTLALLGGIYLLGQHFMGGFFHHLPLAEISMLVLASIVLSLALGASKFEIRLSKQLWTGQNLMRVGLIALLTVISQFIMLSCIALGVLALRPEIPLLSVFAAAAIISFAASLPISINGWGCANWRLCSSWDGWAYPLRMPQPYPSSSACVRRWSS